MLQKLQNMIEKIKKLLDVPSLDPDQKRRGRLLNIFLLGTFILAGLGLIVSVTIDILHLYSPAEMLLIYLTVLSTLIGVVVIWVISRYWSGQAAGYLFLGLLIVTLSFSDNPAEIVAGRSQIAFTFPVVVASVILPAQAGFVVAGLASLAMTLLALSVGMTPNVFGFLTLFGIALAAWLSGRGLERALRDLRLLNKELDQRVQDRTRELAEAVRREHTLAVRNKTILESIADGVLVFDASQKTVMANQAANQLAGRNLQALNLAEFLLSIEDKARETLKNWLVGQKPESHVRFTWQERTISVNLAPVLLHDTDQKQVGMGHVMILRDFTREAELEKAKDLFVGMVSHELRTPLTAVQGYVELLLERIKERVSEEDYQFLQIVNVNAKRLIELVNELVDLSKMEMGKMDLYCHWVKVETLVHNAVKVVWREFERKNLRLEINLNDDLPDLYIDPSRMSQVLLNLLSNACKYTPEGSVTITAGQNDGWVSISVRDTGMGIKEADQARLFERFFRSGDRSVQKIGGTGLGLNISKRLVELHGGALTCTSQYGVGATFTVTLPITGEAATLS